MLEVKSELEGVSIVLVGAFNPQIFQPAWFVAQQLIRADEGDSAELNVIHSEAVSFKIGEWLNLNVTRDRFSVTTSLSNYHEQLRDFVVGTFSLLQHTPITSAGINKEAHYRSASENSWHKLGNTLAPKKHWEGILKKPGMRKLVIQGERDDSHNGAILVRIEPSARIKPGVFILINDHYENTEKASETGCTEIVKIIETNFQKSLKKSDTIALNLLGII